MKIKPIVAVCLSSTLFTGCAPLLLGGVATAGYMSIQDRGAKTAFWDTKLKTHVKERLTSTNYEYATEVGVTVMQGIVLLTGVVASPKQAVEVEKVVRGVEGVNDVYNELYTDGIYSAAQYSEDSWSGTQLRGRLIAAKDVNASNYKISVVNGHAYIMGVTSSTGESERVIHIARTTKGIKTVHNYVKYISDSKSSFFGLPVDSNSGSHNYSSEESLF